MDFPKLSKQKQLNREIWVHSSFPWKFVKWIEISLCGLQFKEIWKFNVPVNFVGFCKCLWITFGQIYYIITWLNNNGMDNRTNLSTRNNGVDNLPKPVQKRFTICPKHLQDHTKLSDHNNISYFSIKMWNKVFTYLEFHKNTSYLCKQTCQLKKWLHFALFLVKLP